MLCKNDVAELKETWKTVIFLNQYKIQTKLARVNCFKYSFFVRIIEPWNNLPDHVFEGGIAHFDILKFKTKQKA